MSHESILRQVALVSYGTKYLRNELALEDWYRHGVFFGARLQFRALHDNALLADDYTVWLGVLKESGALRLSLHLPAEYDINVMQAERRGDYALVVHYTNAHQIWTVGQEREAWRDHPVFDEADRMPLFPNAASYAGDLDSYWHGEKAPGEIHVTETNWSKLAAAIAAELEIDVPSKTVRTGPYFVPTPEAQSWSRLPLFPYSRTTSLAHRVLATLYEQQAKFANDTNFKNENSWYKNLNEQDAAKADAWGVRLNSVILDVELCCANECRGAAQLNAGDCSADYEERRQVPPVAVSGNPEDAASHANGLPTEAVSVEVPSASTNIWTDRIVFFVVFTVASLFILALANIIASFPWLSLLIGLPFALYARYKPKRR